MQLLRDNLTLWTSDAQVGASVEGCTDVLALELDVITCETFFNCCHVLNAGSVG